MIAEAKKPATNGIPISNVEFLWTLATALCALLVSGVILVVGYMLFSPLLGGSRVDSSLDALIITGGELEARLGTGGRTPEGSFYLKALSDSGQAIMTKHLSLRAEDYPFIEVRIINRDPGEKIYLIWRTANQPTQVHREQLYWDGDSTITQLLAKHAQWRGEVTEIGLDVYGNLRADPLLISQLRLLPVSSATLTAAIWSEWTEFHVWNQSSINHLRGTPGEPILSPALAAAFWAGLAILLILAMRLIGRPTHPLVLVISVVVPWIAIDLIWQKRLNIQLEETQYLFAGKSQHARHLTDIDADLYEYALHLKHNALPEPGVRLHLLHQDGPKEFFNFNRLKLQYHLLPHNIYNYGARPRVRHIHPGEYILVLDEIDHMEYDAASQLLTWDASGKLKAELVDQHSRGKLYRRLEAGRK